MPSWSARVAHVWREQLGAEPRTQVLDRLGLRPTSESAAALWADAVWRAAQHRDAFEQHGTATLGREPRLIGDEAYARRARRSSASTALLDGNWRWRCRTGRLALSEKEVLEPLLELSELWLQLELPKLQSILQVTMNLVTVSEHPPRRLPVPVQLPPVDDEVYAALQARAVPLEDDVNTVLRRLLGLASANVVPVPSNPDVVARVAVENSRASRSGAKSPRPKKSAKKRTRVPKGSILPESDYERPILRALDQLGGRVPTSELIAQLEKEIDPHLTEVDREHLSSGGIRWQNRAQFVRLKLIKKGEMVEGSPRGVWEISETGRKRLAKEG